MVGWSDREIAAIGAGQQAIITREQLLALGVGRGANGPARSLAGGCTSATGACTHWCRRRPGVCAHRATLLDARDVRVPAGIPLTSPARTLLDIAPRLSERSLELAFDEALVRGLMTVEVIAGVTARYPKRRGGTARA